MPSKPRFAFVFPLLTFAAIASIVPAFFRPVALFGLLAVACVNVGIQTYYRPRVYHLITPIAAVRALLLAARRLGRLGDPALEPYSARLRESGQRLRSIDRYARHLLRETLGNELLETVAGYGNLLFLLDVNAFVFSIERIRRHREALRDLFETVGFLDAMRAVAHFRSTLPHWCAPEFAATRRKELTVVGLYHPLLDEPVANDLDIRGRGILITGSNMAGKTTFLRAAGICAILAETIATCAARRWHAPPLRIATHIDRGDDIVEGKSYFLVEAEAVRELLARADGEEQHLFIVDEIFRGTNTRERIAAAKAVLDRLDRGDHICLVSTHDLELLDLLGERWEFKHFRETVHDGGVRFDFLIRPGASSAKVVGDAGGGVGETTMAASPPLCPCP